MKIREIGIAVFTALMLAVSVAWAADPSRACKADDLVGIWEMKGMSGNTKKINASDPFVAPYQRFRFTKDGKMAQMVSRKPIEGDPSLDKLLETVLLTSTYSVDPRGVLTIYKIESPNPEKCLCAYLSESLTGKQMAKIPFEERAMTPTKGDVMLTYLSGDGRPIVGKTLRKIK